MRPVAFKLLSFRTPCSHKILLGSPRYKTDNSGTAPVEAAGGPWVQNTQSSSLPGGSAAVPLGASGTLLTLGTDSI